MERLRWLTILLTVLVTSPEWSKASGDEICPSTPECKCKWLKGKWTADCSNAGFRKIPQSLGQDIQTIILDGNPIEQLDKNVFKSSGLVHLQKISLRGCNLSYVDEGAFRDLKILVEVDLSLNGLTKLRPKTFDGNDGLQKIRLSENPIVVLQAYQFPPLRNLKTIDVSNCLLETVDSKTFQNLGGSLQSILLNNNRLKYLDVDGFVGLTSLTNLALSYNPWVCDCKLKSFRDWLIEKKLYAPPVACSEPARLNEKMWNDITTGDFACKPEIYIPNRYVYGSQGQNLSLPCRVTGSPTPQIRWVKNGQIVNNNTSPAPFSDQRWIIREERNGGNSFIRWYNLTVIGAVQDNLGDYVCVAENNAGVMERTVSLTFDDPATLINFGGAAGGGGFRDDQWTVIVGATTAAIVFIGLMILLCCYCHTRKKKKAAAEKKKSMKDSDKNNFGTYGSAISAYDTLPSMSTKQTLEYQEESESLLSPLQMHPHREFMMSTPRGGMMMMGAGGDMSMNTSRGVTPEPRVYVPDLLETSTLTRTMSSPLNNIHGTLPVRKTSTPLSAMHLMHNAPGGVSFHRSGTLPLPHHYHLYQPAPTSSSAASTTSGRSVSCDHTSANPMYQQTRLLPPLQLQQLPLHYHHPLAQSSGGGRQQRPGYVTLPRRPRTSWSAAPSSQGFNSRASPSPSIGSQFSRTEFREPIYDGVGPRTSADGSSKANLNGSTTLPRNQHLNKSFDNSNYGGVVRTPLGSGSGANHGYTLPPYYAPIEEVQECPPTPKDRPRSTPNILDMDNVGGDANETSAFINNDKDPMDSSVVTSNSEITLMEENISSYCEPFGKAVLPSEDEDQESTPRQSQTSSAGSELELLMPEKLIHQVSNQHIIPDATKTVPPQPTARKVPPPPPPKKPSAAARSAAAVAAAVEAAVAENESLLSFGNSELNHVHGESNGGALTPSLTASRSPSSPQASGDSGQPSLNGNDDESPTSLSDVKKVPPKTLPKPKVRSLWNAPPVVVGDSHFQDEGVDGSEV